MKALADAGYAVFAPNHKTQRAETSRVVQSSREAVSRIPPSGAMRLCGTRAGSREAHRCARKDPRYRDAPYDWNHLALVGHSLGGYTVLGVGGGWPRWKDPRVKAILALSPYAVPFIEQQTLRRPRCAGDVPGRHARYRHHAVHQKSQWRISAKSRAEILCRVRGRRAFRVDRSQSEISLRDNRLQPGVSRSDISKGKTFPSRWPPNIREWPWWKSRSDYFPEEAPKIVADPRRGSAGWRARAGPPALADPRRRDSARMTPGRETSRCGPHAADPRLGGIPILRSRRPP